MAGRIRATTSLLAISGIALALAGCNTMAGLGRDTSGAGNALSSSAEQTGTSIDQGVNGTPQGCATPMHQNLPGGTDYHGPPVAGCPKRTL